jgi:hypothetical protein
VVAGYACPRCGGRQLRASVTGARRTAEELGRAFPGVPVRTSGRDEVLRSVPAGPGLVIATPGAEPAADGGYGAVLLLDSWALLTRADLRATEEAVRRWFAAAALARPASAGGQVVVMADGGLATVQALVRWDAAWLAARELSDRREVGFPPAARIASALANALAFLVLTRPTGFLIGIFTHHWASGIRRSDRSLPGAGMWIGLIERPLILLFVLNGLYEAVGFLLAAKSVFRFGDLKDGNDRRRTEYVLIGTLLSFGIAILVGILARSV